MAQQDDDIQNYEELQKTFSEEGYGREDMDSLTDEDVDMTDPM